MYVIIYDAELAEWLGIWLLLQMSQVRIQHWLRIIRLHFSYVIDM